MLSVPTHALCVRARARVCARACMRARTRLSPKSQHSVVSLCHLLSSVDFPLSKTPLIYSVTRFCFNRHTITHCPVSQALRRIPGNSIEVHPGGCFIAQRLVRTPLVVPAKIAGKLPLGFPHVGVILQVHFLVFHRPPKTLDEDVVQVSPPPVHADLNAAVPQGRRECFTRELSPLVAVEYLRASVRERRGQRLHAEPRVDEIAHPPREHVPAEPVHDRHKIREPAPHADVRDVRGPHLVRTLDGQPRQQVRIFARPAIGNAGARPRIDRRKPHHPHQALDALVVYRVTLVSQHLRDFGRAQNRTPCVNRVD